MPEATADKKQHSWIVRNWGKATAVALVVAGFLSWYDAVRNNGRLFVCDAAALVGQGDAIPFCRADVPPPDETDQLALLEYLKEREDQLSPEHLEQLRRLEAYFIERAFEVLMEAADLEEARADAQAAQCAGVHPVARCTRLDRLGTDGDDIAAIADVDRVFGEELVELPGHPVGMDRICVGEKQRHELFGLLLLDGAQVR